jgi:hypothetical protein
MVIESFGGWLPTEALARVTVKAGSDRLDILRRPPGKVSALREVLAQQAVLVLVRALAARDCAGWRRRPGHAVSIVNWACADSFLPRSQVSERHSCAGRVPTVTASASFIVTAPKPASGGPFFVRGTMP